MAKILAKQTFTMRQGEIRVSWKPEVNGKREEDTVGDEDILNYIQKDTVYSKKEKWREVFDILSFDKASNNQKYSQFLRKNAGTLNIAKSDTGKEVLSDNGRLDSRGNNSGYDRQKRINEFPILNDGERNDVLSHFKGTDDLEALTEIRKDLDYRGDKRWLSEVDTIFKTVEMKKAAKAGRATIEGMSKSN